MRTATMKRVLSVLLSVLIVFQIGAVAIADDTGVEGFVTRLYHNIMNREPDAGGLKYWEDGLNDGRYTAASVIDFFFTSDEFVAKNLSDEEYIDILYTTVMGRSADVDGVNFWLGQLNNGTTRRKILSDFIWSSEFSGICDTYGVTRGTIPLSSFESHPAQAAFVSQVYRTILGRNPDAKGLESWVNYLLNGHTACDLILEFTNSSEFVNKNLSDYDYVACLYKALLGREGSDIEINGWLSNMYTHHTSKRLLLKNIAGSTEFANICNNAGVTVGSISVTENRDKNSYYTDYVVNAYKSILGRDVSNEDLNFWTGKLMESYSAKDFLDSLLGTTEFKNRNLSNSEIVSAVFSAALGRSASSDDITFYENIIKTKGMDEFLSIIYSSTEFTNRCSTVGLPAIYCEGWNNTASGKIYVSGGNKLSGWQRLGGKRYYFNPANNNCAATGWLYIGGLKYYFNPDGTLNEDTRSLVSGAGGYQITVNCTTNTVTIYAKDENGNYCVPVKAMICSTGAAGATPAGTFTTRRLGRWHPLMGDCYGQYCTQINGNILFHSVWYYVDGNANTQSVKEYRKLGQSVSHGCIRLTVADAKWIYENCAGCTVKVTYNAYEPAPFDRPTPPAITALYGDYGHDPTDIWS